jgi:hypothetical protein
LVSKLFYYLKKSQIKNFVWREFNILAGICGKIAVANCHKNKKVTRFCLELKINPYK